jgi:hypothetical protein
VSALYEAVLGRPVDPSAPWVGLLNSGSQSRFDVATAVLKSGEADMDVVTGLYKTYLRRAPDPGGLQGNVAALLNGARFEQLLAGLVSSTEYQTRAGNQNLVTNVYIDVLGRPADGQGLSAFTGLLRGGASRSQVVQTFLGKFTEFLVHEQVCPICTRIALSSEPKACSL